MPLKDPKQFNVRISTLDYKKLGYLAWKRRKSRSAFIRMLIRKSYQEYKERKKK